MDWNLEAITETYNDADSAGIKALYQALGNSGPKGVVAMSLFHSSRWSDRAAACQAIPGRGGYKHTITERKAASIDILNTMLMQHGYNLEITWGWTVDPEQPFHAAILCAELPPGQVSFHVAARGIGPTFHNWVGGKDANAPRVIAYCASVFPQRGKE